MLGVTSAVARVEDAPDLGPPVRAEHGAGAEQGIGVVEDLHDVVAGLRRGDEPADFGLGHALLQLRLDGEGDVIGQALDLPELVELRGGVRKGTAGHVWLPRQAFERWERPSHRCR